MALADTLQTIAEKHFGPISCILRHFLPILKVGELTVVSRFDDVQEVLSRPDAFGVTYAEKMGIVTAGSNFFLGMNNTPTYTRDVSNMRILIRREDVDSIVSPTVTNLCESIIAGKSGSLDVVQDLGGPVAARLARDYFGTPGSSEAELIDWTTYLFQYLFFPNNPKDVDAKAVSDAKKLREYLDALIAERKANPVQNDDVVTRSLALQASGAPGMTDQDIRNNLIGTLIGAIPTTSKCVALVIDYLLDNPKLLKGAQEAAKNNDIALVRQYVLETLRFNSFGAGVFRVMNEDYVLARGNMRSKKIKKGTRVLALTQSAMLDGKQLPCPSSFKLDRPLYHYMHFGYGMHTCFGYYINLTQIPLIVASILKLPNLRRAGKIEMRGPFPTSLPVTYG